MISHRLALAAMMVFFATGGIGFAQKPAFRPTRPQNILGKIHPGRMSDVSNDGIVVDLKDGGTQVVQYGEIWRIRQAFASDEPPKTSVIDFANNRLFVVTPVPDLIATIGKRVPITKLTAPNGDTIYLAANKVTDVSAALPGLHNPSSKSVVGTRDGEQQVMEPTDTAKRMIAESHTVQ